MASDDAARLAAVEAATAALPPHVADKMATLQAVEKKVVKVRTCVHAITLLLKEEQASTAALEAMVRQLP
jgi:hypothetical protein